MLTSYILSATERAELSATETLALEYVLHTRLSDLARARRSGDTALLHAVRAADALTELAAGLGHTHATEIIRAVRHSDSARCAIERAVEFAGVASRAA